MVISQSERRSCHLPQTKLALLFLFDRRDARFILQELHGTMIISPFLFWVFPKAATAHKHEQRQIKAMRVLLRQHRSRCEGSQKGCQLVCWCFKTKVILQTISLKLLLYRFVFIAPCKNVLYILISVSITQVFRKMPVANCNYWTLKDRIPCLQKTGKTKVHLCLMSDIWCKVTVKVRQKLKCKK